MNAGRAITEAMRDERKRDLHALMWCHLHGSLPYLTQLHLMRAWCWWGWSIQGKGRGLGKPGYP